LPTGKVLIFYGVPRAVAGASRTQTLLLWAFGIGVVLSFYVWPIFVFAFGIVATIFAIAFILGGVALLYMLGRGTRSGGTRYVAFPGAIGIEPADEKERETTVARTKIRLEGGEVISIRRVHPVWCRLEIHKSGRRGKLLDTGFRCPVGQEQQFETNLRRILATPVKIHTGPAAGGGISSGPMSSTGATTTSNDSTA